MGRITQPLPNFQPREAFRLAVCTLRLAYRLDAVGTLPILAVGIQLVNTLRVLVSMLPWEVTSYQVTVWLPDSHSLWVFPTLAGFLLRVNPEIMQFHFG